MVNALLFSVLVILALVGVQLELLCKCVLRIFMFFFCLKFHIMVIEAIYLQSCWFFSFSYFFRSLFAQLMCYPLNGNEMLALRIKIFLVGCNIFWFEIKINGYT